MARRQNTAAGPGATEHAAPVASEQAIEDMAERVAEKAVIKVLDAVSDRFVKAFTDKIQDGIVERIAASVAERIAAAAPAQDKFDKQDNSTSRLEEEEEPQRIAASVVEAVPSAVPVPEEVDKQGETTPKLEDDQPQKMAASVAETIPATAPEEVNKQGKITPRLEDDGTQSQPPARSTRRRGARKRPSPETEEVPPEKKPRTARKPRTSRNPEAEDKVAEAVEGPATRARVKKTNNPEAENNKFEAENYKMEEPGDETDDENLPSDNLLIEALKPLDDKDIEEWGGWAEVESEPAFFNFILNKLGVQGLAVRELLSLDHWGLNYLPTPVHGLVFLFQYAPQLADDDDEDHDEEPVWFANQTTNNSCASVALLNIVMNAENVELGEKLQAFKDSTRDLSTPLRGNSISTNGFIRAAHNSFVRRMDQLNADLCLAWEADADNAKGPGKTPAPKRVNKQSTTAAPKKAPKKTVKPDVEYSFHFIAYVPAGGFVWELDGMRTKPRRIGALGANQWTDVAAPRIQDRIEDYGESQFGFSLLAVCRSPLLVNSGVMASGLAAIHLLRDHFQDDTDFANALDSQPEVLLLLHDEDYLGEFGLKASDVAVAELPADAEQKMQAEIFGPEEACNLLSELAGEVCVAMAKYREEMQTAGEEADRVAGRQKDYTPALHLWMTKLAELGVLEDVIGASQ
ncbi:hypothetical protein XA68_15340 [Ophiocordyceps unilateralis]|uniref:Ubiquitin carboxyl-terminal hydrolase n=1 Tax=Ophiocordyceps unilateralis TaxID=268505 RepID=A0A2A9P8A8_OPHUN|nr:hypothetical protein XA68_15340 [Ophiocordyceps unilateralis]